MRKVTLLLVAVPSVLFGLNEPRERARNVPKPAWEWAVEERLAKRFDPVQIEARNAAWAEDQRRQGRAITSKSANEGAAPAPVAEYVIDGSRDPELFLSHELFDALLTGLAADEAVRKAQRDYYGPAIRKLGYDETAFWNSLASVTTGYLATQPAAMNCSGSTDEVSACVAARCASRYRALEASRQLFGKMRFEKILYTVIAPTLQQATASLDSANANQALLKAESGCAQ